MSAVTRTLLILLLGTFIGLALFPLFNRQSPDPSATRTSDTIDTSRRNAIVLAVEKVAPVVVSINTAYERDLPRYPDRFFEPFDAFSDMRRIPDLSFNLMVTSSPVAML